jgi:four helix bundle protein
MTEVANPKRYDLDDRTFRFAKPVRAFLKTIPRTVGNLEDAKQLVRASGSVAANYIEANESLSKKDFRMRIKICRKESKESQLFLRLLDTGQGDEVEQERGKLAQESLEFVKIFSAILRESE